MRFYVLFCAAVVLAGCGTTRTVSLDDYGTQVIGMPDGKKVRVERLVDARDMQRGMMFRDSLAPDRGMLFVHGTKRPYTYWMYQVKIPLDIIWLDENGRVVEISANTPPCQETDSARCPTYGGHEPSAYALELAGGMAAKYGIHVDSMLSF